jgi:hypothetical protein
MDKPQSIASWAWSRILLSFLSALAGWFAATVYLALYLAITVAARPSHYWTAATSYSWLMGFCCCMGVVVFFVWIFVLIPLAEVVPPSSAFWRPRILPLIGAATGPSIMLFLTLQEQSVYQVRFSVSTVLSDIQSGAFVFGFPSLIVGGVAGYVAAILNRRSLRLSRHSAQNL